MKDKFELQLIKAPEKELDFSAAHLFALLKGYFQKVFWYAKAQIIKRRRSYRSMFIISIIMLSFVFINLILNEARIMGRISSSYGGSHHVMFLGVDGTQAKGAAEYRKVTDSVIIPVIATLESSVDSTTVGKVAVLTEEVQRFMQVGITHGAAPGDNEVIVPRHIYSNHNFLILGREQDMYFDSADFIYRPMTMSGIYNSTDMKSPYIFVNEATGEAIKEACGNKVVFDVFLILDYASDRNSAYAAKQIIRDWKIRDTEEQQVHKDSIAGERSVYKDYINTGASNARFHATDINKVGSYLAVIIAALIMSSFMTNYTERHISEYGVLAAYGAKRRHLFGVVIGQVLFVTVLSLIPVLILSLGAAGLYTFLYNQARLASNLPVVMSIPAKTLFQVAVWYVVILCAICSVTMNRMLSQFPFPMVRGSTAAKIPFVKKSSKWIAKAKDKVRHISFLQSLRLVKRNIIPALATSVICVACAMYIGYNYLQVMDLGNKADDYTGRQFDGKITAIFEAGYQNGFWRGFIQADDVRYLSELDGVDVAGGMRTKGYLSKYGNYNNGVGTFTVLVDEAHASITDEVKNKFDFARNMHPEISRDARREYEQILKTGYQTPFMPYYCDPEILPFLYTEVLDGDPMGIYDAPNTIIIVDNAWADDAGHYHAGDVVKVTGEEAYGVEMTVAAVVTGRHIEEWGLTMSNGKVILSPETGEIMDGFSAELRRTVYFMYDEDLTEEEYQNLCDEIANNVNIIRYDAEFYETQRLKLTKMAALENGMTTAFFAMLYITMCVLDYYHANESILAQRKEFCTLRQMGAGDRAIYKTTRTSVYAGQVISVVFTVLFAFIGMCIISGYCANLSNMYRMDFAGQPQILEEMLAMVRKFQNESFLVIGALLALSIPFHGLAVLTAVAGTILPTKQILKENIAAILKGSAEI